MLWLVKYTTFTCIGVLFDQKYYTLTQIMELGTYSCFREFFAPSSYFFWTLVHFLL